MGLHSLLALATAAVAAVATLAAASDFRPTIYEGTPPPGAHNSTGSLANPLGLDASAKDDWYIEDHPFFYLMAKMRAPNGSWIDNPEYSIPPFTAEEWRGNTMQRVPWWIRWYVTGDTRALRKEMVKRRKDIIDHVVSPMDYGRSLRAQSVRAQWHEQLRHFWTEALGTYVVKNLKRNLHTLLFGGLQQYIQFKLYMKNITALNETELGLHMNMTPDEIKRYQETIKEEVRWKSTLPYEYKLPSDLSPGVQQSIPAVGRTVRYFQPYTNYTNRYYNAKEDLPPPTMPAAISYPWPWAERISQVRLILVEVMRAEAARNSLANANMSGNQTSRSPQRGLRGVVNEKLLVVEDEVVDDDDTESDTDGSTSTNDTTDDATKAAAIQRLEEQTKEFHFTSGIPRMDLMATRYSPVQFPSLHDFLNLTIEANGSMTIGQHSAEPDAGEPSNPLDPVVILHHNFSSREDVYTAAKCFYSFDTMEDGYALLKDYYHPSTEPPPPPTDGTILVQDITPQEKIARAECSVRTPCSVRSGVTVYSPSLSAAVAEIFGNYTSTTVPIDVRRQKRLNWLMHMFQVAFDAEHRVLKTGLLAPSTVWYSFFDRDTDLLADSVFGFVNASIAAATDSGVKVEPREIFEGLLGNSSSPLVASYSHFQTTNSRTRTVMLKTQKVPQLVSFTDQQLMLLVGFLQDRASDMQTAISKYVQTRDADPMHVAIVNATQHEVYYDGRLFGVLGFGYFLPATNEANVAYRDHKIPEPFHLIMRLLVRLQEGHVILPDESIRLATCFAMLQFDVRYYRCNEMRDEEKATPKPMQEEPVSPVPPSRTMATPRA